MNLYPFQERGVQWLRQHPRTLLADQMGLGKTPQALMALPYDARVLVVCPAVMKHVWADECRRWRDDFVPVILKGKNALNRWPQTGELLICNYDILPARPPQGFPEWLFLICDEAHYVKSSQALRTKKVRALSRMARTVWFLTGTPLLNEPLDLWNVLEGAGLAKSAFDDFAGWMRLFHAQKIDLGSSRPGGKRWAKWVYGRVDPSVPERLRRVMLRRRREDVLPELPVKTYDDIVVDLDDPDAKRLCDEAAVELQKAGIDISDALDRADIDSIQGEVLGALSKARAALSEAKLPWAIELTDSLLAQGESVIFFSAHRAPVELMGQGKGWGMILGGVKPEVRNDLVSQFQDGLLKGLALTIGAGGVGITLTKAAHVVFVDLDWVPALNSQAEDRAVRIGQTRGVVIHRIIADHPVDRWVTKALARKQVIIEASMEAATVKE